MNDDEIKADIIEACRKFQDHGHILGQGSFGGSDHSRGCALTALAVEKLGHPRHRWLNTEKLFFDLNERYGWSREAAWAFVWGFDDSTRMEESKLHPNIHEIGVQVRKEVLP